jgi:suppressor for copper-sensitivity B
MRELKNLLLGSCKRLFVCLALFTAGVTSVQAAASAWVGDHRSEVRLITATDSVGGGVLQAGLEFRYPGGWHGYWRTPGDTGIAPTLNWATSVNLRSASVAWPAPSRLVVSGLQNAVYSGDFVLPLVVRMDKTNVAARLNLSLDYASCSNVCVPEHADLSLVLPAGSARASAEAGTIAKAWALVPRAPGEGGIKVLQCTLQGTGVHQRLNLQLHSDRIPFREPDLFVEGIASGLPPAPSIRMANQGHDVVLTVALPQRDRAVHGAPLRLTVVDGPRAVEFNLTLKRVDNGAIAAINEKAVK